MKRKADEFAEEEELTESDERLCVKDSMTAVASETTENTEDHSKSKHIRIETSDSTRHVKKPKSSKPSSQPSKSSSPASFWATAKFSAHAFEGHNDLIVAVHSIENTILSGG
ncbi:uncharacterized protein LOC117109241 [Anneissia japonica]|nr:uncharacterized protein LOC117109241 [Anneissia japonica]